MRKHVYLLVLVVLTHALCCQTTKKEAAPTPEPVRAAGFVPATRVAAIQFTEGRNPNLFSPDSYAVWVDPNVTALKQTQAVEAGETIDPELEASAKSITDGFLIIECHIASVFNDSSIAYDVAWFRSIGLYLRTPDGTDTKPLQTVIDTTVETEEQGALKKFSRTNLLVFPKEDLWSAKPVISPDAPSVKLILKGFDSEFSFEWPGAAPAAGSGKPWYPTDEKEALLLLKTGFTELFNKLRKLATHFQ